MTLYISNRDGNGKTDERGHYKFPAVAFSGEVVMPGLAVTQNSPTGMSVLIATGDYRIPTSDYAYTGWNTASVPITITTSDPANPRIDTIVLYVDKSSSTSASPPNNPGIAKAKVVNGTPNAIPTAPNGTTIQSSVGAGNPYIILADVRVNAAVTSILNANITDRRTRATVAADFVTTTSILDQAVTSAKIANATIVSADIAASGVATSNIADANVTTAKIADANVTTAKIANGAVTTQQFRPSIINSNFAVAGTRWAQTTTATWQNITNCSLNYTAGPTNETLFLWLTVMAYKDAGGEGDVRLAVGGVGQTGEMYFNPGNTVWPRCCYGYVVDVAANATVAITVQSKNASGGTFQVANDLAAWVPKVTGFSVWRS